MGVEEWAAPLTVMFQKFTQEWPGDEIGSDRKGGRTIMNFFFFFPEYVPV